MSCTRFSPSAIALVIALAVSDFGHAATSTGNLTVTATVSDTCTIATTALNFPVLNTGSTTVDAAPGTISVICTAAKGAVSIVLGGGSNESAGQRRLSNGGSDFIPYALFADTARAAPLAIGSTLYSGSIPATSEQTFPVYGRVPAGTYPAGNYSDVLSVTLNY